MNSTPARIALPAALAATTALLLTACGGGSDAVRVAAPAPDAAVAAQCAALHAALPQTLMGLHRRTTDPAGTTTAAWGDPAVVLRCGTGMPPVLDPHSRDYNPESDNLSGAEIGGICWASVYNQADRSFTFSSVNQHAIVEVRVPAAYSGQQTPLTGLAQAVAKASPLDKDNKFTCA